MATMLARLLHTALCLFVCAHIVSGQAGQCTGTGCSCDPGTYACCLHITEGVPIGTEVGLATIHNDIVNIPGDPNSLVYTINPEISFVIDRQTGNITTSVQIDREGVMSTCNTFPVTVTTDMSSESELFAVEIIDINDNPPIFSADSINITIPETTDKNPQIVCTDQVTRPEFNRLMASDADSGPNAALTYSILGTTVLTISDPSASSLCIQNNQPLDRDSPDYEPIEFTLVATDGGDEPLSASVTVRLSLQGVNEFAPEIPPNSASVQVREDTEPGVVVYQFQATDQDVFDTQQQITYRIQDVDPTLFPFTFNEATGELLLNETVDAEALVNEYTFTLVASDSDSMEGTSPITITVTDYNEPATFIPPALIKVTENEMSEVGLGALVIMDRDLTFKNNTIIIVSGSDIFSLEEFDVGFLIKQIAPVDRESPTPVEFTVQLIEEGVPRYTNQTQTIPIEIIDVNDNPPELNITSFEFAEGSFSFESILIIGDYVIDPDEGQNAEVRSIVLVSAEDSNSRDLTSEFASYQVSGTTDLGVNGQLIAPPIDREVVGNIITINVNITDNGSPPLWKEATFTLSISDLNDNSPMFNSLEYSFEILENTDIAGIGQVEATDPDNGENGTVTYSLENGTDLFTINNVTGIIQSRRRFNREEVSEYTLRVSARDNGDPSKTAASVAIVHVEILDENDNDPFFNHPNPVIITMSTSTAANSIIGTVDATDQDIGVNAEIEYRLTPQDFFEINSMGNITLVQQITMVTNFSLAVTARNPGSNIEASINVMINVQDPTLSVMEIAIIGSAGALVLILLVICFIVICYCCCCRNRRGGYNVSKNSKDLNNLHPHRVDSLAKPILKSGVAKANGSVIPGRERVKFSNTVIRIDCDGAVTDGNVTIQESAINHKGSDDSPQVPNRGSPLNHRDNGIIMPSEIMELEHSPGHMMNGISDDEMIGMPRQPYEMRPLAHNPHLDFGQNMPDNDRFSQGNSSTTSYNSEEESTFSDHSSRNTSIPRFVKDERSMYAGPPPSHPPLYTHHPTSHLPEPDMLDLIHQRNMAALAAAQDSYHTNDGHHSNNGYHSNGYPLVAAMRSQSHSTSDTSSQMTTPSPNPRMIGRIERIGSGPRSVVHRHPNGAGMPPLIMPDAYPPTALPDIHRCADAYVPSLSDDNSTCISVELDEALVYPYEPEPSYYMQLSATVTQSDYDETT